MSRYPINLSHVQATAENDLSERYIAAVAASHIRQVEARIRVWTWIKFIAAAAGFIALLLGWTLGSFVALIAVFGAASEVSDCRSWLKGREYGLIEHKLRTEARERR